MTNINRFILKEKKFMTEKNIDGVSRLKPEINENGEYISKNNQLLLALLVFVIFLTVQVLELPRRKF